MGKFIYFLLKKKEQEEEKNTWGGCFWVFSFSLLPTVKRERETVYRCPACKRIERNMLLFPELTTIQQMMENRVPLARFFLSSRNIGDQALQHIGCSRNHTPLTSSIGLHQRRECAKESPLKYRGHQRP